MDILSLRDVSKIYGELKALDQINLTVEKGEWIAIMGPSGSGKTTMMNIIGCMDKPSLGEVILDGTDITKRSQKELTEVRRDKIGLVFQQFHLVNYLTALENVMMAQYYHSMPDEEEAMEALREVGLADRAKHLPNQLSGGEQQMLAMGRALMSKPEMLVLDEPSMGLSPIYVNEIFDIIKSIHESGTTVLLVEQNAKKALSIANRAYVLETGTIRISGTAEALLNNDEVKSAYLSE